MPGAAGLYYFAHEGDDRSRPPVVLIHGAGGDHLYWPPQLRRLPGWQLIVPDLPGHGKSAGLGHHSIEEYARHLMEFLTELRIFKAALIGHSMGGAIALSAAAQYPQRVVALGLVACGARLRVSSSLLSRFTASAGYEGTVDQVIESSFSRHANERLKHLARQRMLDTRPAVLHGDFLACNEFDASAQLEGLSIPTQIVCGAEDHMTPPRLSEYLHRHVAGSRLDLVPNAGHMVMLEQPNLITELFSGFLAKHV
jgi:pimeloyl-ACP methyl ester carboxylesterase